MTAKRKRKPALAPEQWWDLKEHAGEVLDSLKGPAFDYGLAASLLSNRAHGFTWKDVKLLRYAAESMYGDVQAGPRLLHLAARIEALLPPWGRCKGTA